MSTLDTSIASDGVYLQYDQLLGAMCGDTGAYTRLWNMSVDLPFAAEAEVPLCCTTRVCFFFCNPFRVKSVVHDSTPLYESNPTG